MQTHLVKNGRAWRAETVIEIEAQRRLIIGTVRSANYPRTLVTQAFVESRGASGALSYTVGHPGDPGDFNRAIQIDTVPRQTRQAVHAVHARALQRLRHIKALVQQHYLKTATALTPQVSREADKGDCHAGA